MPQLPSNSIPINKQETNPDIYFDESETGFEPYPETANTQPNGELSIKETIKDEICIFLGVLLFSSAFVAIIYFLPIISALLIAITIYGLSFYDTYIRGRR